MAAPSNLGERSGPLEGDSPWEGKPSTVATTPTHLGAVSPNYKVTRQIMAVMHAAAVATSPRAEGLGWRWPCSGIRDSAPSVILARQTS